MTVTVTVKVEEGVKGRVRVRVCGFMSFSGMCGEVREYGFIRFWLCNVVRACSAGVSVSECVRVSDKKHG